MPVEVKMPQLGESVHEGTIGKWLKQEGEPVREYEPLLEVITDKVDTEITSPGTGTLLQILAPAGQVVAVGTVLAFIGAEGEVPPPPPPPPPAPAPAPADAAPSASPPPTPASGSSAASVATGPGPAAPTAPAPAASTPAAPPPAAAPTAPRVTPVAARVAAGHGVDPAHVRGTGPGGQVTRGDVERHVQALAAAGPAPTGTPAGAAADRAPGASVGFVSPRVARLSAELGVDLRQVPGTGRDGRITARDVEAFAAAHPAPPGVPRAGADRAVPGPAPSTPAGAPPAAPPPAGVLGELIELTTMRRSIAEHMVRSKQISPHVGTVHEADMSAVMAAYRALREPYAERGVKLTITAFIVQAVAEALSEHPLLNSSWTDAGIQIHRDVNIGLAVAIPTGLIVPVVHKANEKNLLGLAREVTDLATRARNKQLRPDDVQGGTFTLTNYGTLGSLFGTPVINQPQAAILGTGAIKKRVVVLETAAGDTIGIRPMMFLALTFDHRILDGGTADPFVQTIARKLEGYQA